MTSRTSLTPSNEIWRTLSDEEKKRINKLENERIDQVQEEDEVELLRRVDAAGPKGYKLPEVDFSSPDWSEEKLKDAIAMMNASGRMCANPNGFSNKKSSLLKERSPFVLIRNK